MQNTSHAVMAQRVEEKNSLDDFPTPPWATRALIEHIIERETGTNNLTVLEPACGRGYMAQALAEYFGSVTALDVHDYGYGDVGDFLGSIYETDAFDWVITNPPFRLAEEFIQRAMPIARRGVAMLVRTVFIESVGRYQRLFEINPPTKLAQYSERVPMVKGRVDKKASTATGYAWVIWEKTLDVSPALIWVPPCRKSLERLEDYEASFVNRQGSEFFIPTQSELFG
ncbi:hypothetical protein PEL8287_02233 [Roseovarius litorisediminis]|uniref:Methyltransferase n=1 Tax=Roseovarius litorisediminis TaxID=1312363 RepID=A0A1Y5SQ77_9RHOB|nr:hypothetical protein [Roseovarius litorisediminis]SLN44156.1 hypothetical protein PEL8287_02233 [Roseovarius litorisediminis]